MWTVEGLIISALCIFEPLKADTDEPNISLIRPMLIIQNPECLTNVYIFDPSICLRSIHQHVEPCQHLCALVLYKCLCMRL